MAPNFRAKGGKGLKGGRKFFNKMHNKLGGGVDAPQVVGAVKPNAKQHHGKPSSSIYRDNKPKNYMLWFDSAKFTSNFLDWLHMLIVLIPSLSTGKENSYYQVLATALRLNRPLTDAEVTPQAPPIPTLPAILAGVNFDGRNGVTHVNITMAQPGAAVPAVPAVPFVAQPGGGRNRARAAGGGGGVAGVANHQVQYNQGAPLTPVQQAAAQAYQLDTRRWEQQHKKYLEDLDLLKAACSTVFNIIVQMLSVAARSRVEMEPEFVRLSDAREQDPLGLVYFLRNVFIDNATGDAASSKHKQKMEYYGFSILPMEDIHTAGKRFHSLRSNIIRLFGCAPGGQTAELDDREESVSMTFFLALECDSRFLGYTTHCRDLSSRFDGAIPKTLAGVVADCAAYVARHGYVSSGGGGGSANDVAAVFLSELAKVRGIQSPGKPSGKPNGNSIPGQHAAEIARLKKQVEQLKANKAGGGNGGSGGGGGYSSGKSCIGCGKEGHFAFSQGKVTCPQLIAAQAKDPSLKDITYKQLVQLQAMKKAGMCFMATMEDNNEDWRSKPAWMVTGDGAPTCDYFIIDGGSEANIITDPTKLGEAFYGLKQLEGNGMTIHGVGGKSRKITDAAKTSLFDLEFLVVPEINVNIISQGKLVDALKALNRKAGRLVSRFDYSFEADVFTVSHEGAVVLTFQRITKAGGGKGLYACSAVDLPSNIAQVFVSVTDTNLTLKPPKTESPPPFSGNIELVTSLDNDDVDLGEHTLPASSAGVLSEDSFGCDFTSDLLPE